MSVGPWLRRSRRQVYANDWLTVFHDEVVRPDGSPGVYGVIHFPYPAVGIVAIDASDRVALVGQWRYALDAESWEIPEGAMADGEQPLEGARRELREETGITAREWRSIGHVQISNSVTDEVGHLFVATGLTNGVAQPDATEQISLRWVAFDEALAMTLDGRISDAFSVLAIQRVALERARATASRTERA